VPGAARAAQWSKTPSLPRVGGEAVDKGQRWQDRVNLILGVWLFFSPFLLAYDASFRAPSSWNAYLVGIGVVVFATEALGRFRLWREWINFGLGAWLLVAPWVLAFDEPAAVWNQLIIGVLVAANALWAMRASRVRGH
jgi:hypothetical protein